MCDIEDIQYYDHLYSGPDHSCLYLHVSYVFLSLSLFLSLSSDHNSVHLVHTVSTEKGTLLILIRCLVNSMYSFSGFSLCILITL